MGLDGISHELVATHRHGRGPEMPSFIVSAPVLDRCFLYELTIEPLLHADPQVCRRNASSRFGTTAVSATFLLRYELAHTAFEVRYTRLKRTHRTMQAPKSFGHANGIDGPLNPFGITPPPPDASEDEIPGYVKRFGAYVSAKRPGVSRFS